MIPVVWLGWGAGSLLLGLFVAMVAPDDAAAAGGADEAPSSGGLAGAGAAADSDLSSAEAGSAAAPCSDRQEGPGPGQFQFRIINDDGEPLELRQPLEYRVCNAAGAVVQEGTYQSGGTITVNADPAGRYALWLDGEYVTFHDEVPEEDGEP